MRKSMKPLMAAMLLAAASTTPAFAADGDSSLAAQQQYDNARMTGEQAGWGIKEGSDVRSWEGYTTNSYPNNRMHDMWDNTRAHMHQWRENTANAFHRMTGTGYHDDDATVRSGAAATTDDHTLRSRNTLRSDTDDQTLRSRNTVRSDTDDQTLRSRNTVRSDVNGVSSNRPDPQAAPAAHVGGTAPGPAAADAARDAQGMPLQTNRDRGGPSGSGSKGTVDPTGVGAATQGGSPYGGNQDPNRPNGGSSSNNGNP